MRSSIQNKYTFSGHDSFQCRQFWLKKGYDYLISKKAFNDDDAVVKLGVGKNMVSAIRYWMKSFNIIDSDDLPTEFGIRLLDNDGWDPFLEDDASLWLLHYQLIKTNHASIYNLIFNDFRKEKILFNKDAFLKYLARKKETEDNLKYNVNTVADDFVVFVKMYQANPSSRREVEDGFLGILTEIELLKTMGDGKDEIYQIENSVRDLLPAPILLYSILDNPNYGNAISLNNLENEPDSPGSIFALNRLGLVNKLLDIENENKHVTFTDHAGIKELQFKQKPDAFSILDDYYGK